MSFQIILSSPHGDLFPMPVVGATTVQQLKARLAQITGQSPAAIQVLLNGRIVADTTTMEQAGIKENDVLSFGLTRPATQQQQQLPSNQVNSPNFNQVDLLGNLMRFMTQPVNPDGPVPGAPAADHVRAQILSDPGLAANLRGRDASLMELIDDASPEGTRNLQRLLNERHTERIRREEARARRIAELNANPFDPNAQREIADLIREQNVQDNLELAMEHHPEAFGSVVMLYIKCEVNGVPVKAFVDTGAQMTIMSKECAEHCNIMRLLDTKWAGTAVGVGTSRILGRVHVAPMKIGRSFIQSSFSVLENAGLHFILGLDMLKRHQCVVDLKANCLRIGDDETPFLSEQEIPKGDMQPVGGSPGSNLPPRDALSHRPPLSSVVGDAPPSSANSSEACESPSNALPAPSSNASEFPEEHVQRLMELGFSRQQAVAALQMSNGNVDVAASHLTF